VPKFVSHSRVPQRAVPQCGIPKCVPPRSVPLFFGPPRCAPIGHPKESSQVESPRGSPMWCPAGVPQNLVPPSVIPNEVAQGVSHKGVHQGFSSNRGRPVVPNGCPPICVQVGGSANTVPQGLPKVVFQLDVPFGVLQLRSLKWIPLYCAHK
jgi:hypothetical protein